MMKKNTNKLSPKAIQRLFIAVLFLTFLINGYLMIKPKAQVSPLDAEIAANTANTVVQTKNMLTELKELKKYREEFQEMLKNVDFITKYKIYSNLFIKAKSLICYMQNLEVKLSMAVNKSRFYSPCGYSRIDEVKYQLDAVMDLIDLVKSQISMTPKERTEIADEANKKIDETKLKIESTIQEINEDNLEYIEREIRINELKY